MAKKYWYRICCEWCPVCGSEDRWRERVYGRKPKRVKSRYQTNERYDWCDV